MTRFDDLSPTELRAVETALATAFVMADSTTAWAGLIRAYDELEPPLSIALPHEGLVEQVRWATPDQKQYVADTFVRAVVRGNSDAACVELLSASAVAMREAVPRTHPIWDELAGITGAGPLSAPRPEKPPDT